MNCLLLNVNYLGTVKYLSLFVIYLALPSCTTVSSLSESQITTGAYDFRPSDAPSKEFTKVHVSTRDSVSIIPLDKEGNGLQPIGLAPGQVFRKPSFDIDVLVVLFKYRPSSFGFPSQLTADFNGNVFLGYRLDHYAIEDKKTPAGRLRRVRQRAFAIGGFAGLGTSFISPWTTNYRTTDEYNGFVLSHGISAMVGIKILTFGVAVGWDYLTDRDKDIWIYQNTPWYGATLSLNLN